MYPHFRWRSTSPTGDGGKDGIGELRDLRDGITEIYWMEAKNHPAAQSLGKYTLDTHLVSAFFSQSVRRLHVVTSGSLSTPFIARADAFSKEHGFVFAYSDREALEEWLASRRDLIRTFFADVSSEVLTNLVETHVGGRTLFARALIVADNDGLAASTVSVKHLLPGRKFRLIVTVSLAVRISREQIPLRLKWSPPARVSLLVKMEEDAAVLTFDPLKEPIVSIPFRLLSFGSSRLPNPTIAFSNQCEAFSVALDDLAELPRLAAPFVGTAARLELQGLHRLIREEVAMGKPRLVICRGRAGAGKTRLAEELRDTAQILGFKVRVLEMTSTPSSQEERWRMLFRWIFGLEQNPFDLAEDAVLDRRLKALSLEPDVTQELHRGLAGFLINGLYSEDLFNLDTTIGHMLADAVRESFTRGLASPILIHLDDLHHVSRQQLRPLYLFRHLIDTSDALPLCLFVTARNDDTVRDNSFDHFVNGLDLSGSPGFRLIDLPEMTLDDARELVVSTLRWPELRAQESKTLALIIERATTNPFFLMQTLDLLAMDYETVAFGHGDDYFLVNIPAFKKALRQLPKLIRDILSQRFAGLLRRNEGELLRILATIAIVGRSAPRTIVNRALGRALSEREVGRLLALGYLADASKRHLELMHDLLVEALRDRPEAREAATALSRSIGARGDLLTAEQVAGIYYAAGPRYFHRSWVITRKIVEQRFRRQEYLTLPPTIQRLENIASSSPILVFDSSLEWIAAISEQHSGNTQAALARFQRIRDVSEKALPRTAERFVDATIEIANQLLLRAEPSGATEIITDALTIVDDTGLRLPSTIRNRLRALAHNRCGAALHLLEQSQKATGHFEAALRAADTAHDDFLFAHTHWNIAAQMRFRDPAISACHLQEARHLWKQKLRHEERFRLMIDCSEAFSVCLTINTVLSRAHLRAIAAEASEKGYLFQASETLVCLATCAMSVDRWTDAREVLLRALDLTAATEDLRARTFIVHYLSICAHKLGAAVECRDWCWQATRSLTDKGLKDSEFGQRLNYNEKLISGTPGSSHTAELLWKQYDRV